MTEREWLEDREYASYHYSCQWCSQYDPMLIMPDRQNVPCMWYATCPCNTNNYDYKDALEFSERVAARLTDWLAQDMGCFVCGEKICKLKQKDRSCREKLLKAARLQVEEEMDENS